MQKCAISKTLQFTFECRIGLFDSIRVWKKITKFNDLKLLYVKVPLLYLALQVAHTNDPGWVCVVAGDPDLVLDGDPAGRALEAHERARRIQVGYEELVAESAENKILNKI